MTRRSVRTLVYAAVSLVLAGGVVFAAVMAARMTDAAVAAPADHKVYLARLAWVCVVVAAMVAVALVWVVMRFLAFRISDGPRHAKTEHVDAWKLSGERFKLTKEDEERLESEWGEDKS